MQGFRFRQLDYILLYFSFATLLIAQLSELLPGSIIAILIGSFVPSLVLGTITNLLVKKNNSY